MLTLLPCRLLLKAAIALLPCLISVSIAMPVFSSPIPLNSFHFSPPAPPDPSEPSDRPQGGGTRLYFVR